MTEPIVDYSGWSRVTTVYQQCLQAVQDDEPYLPHTLVAFLAELLSRVSVNYYGHEDDFVRDAYKHFSFGLNEKDLYDDQRFHSISSYQESTKIYRRRPTPYETIVETSRRLRDLNTLTELFSKVSIGIVLGGSLSYGRFFNVVGQLEEKASDIDLYIVVENKSDVRNVIDAMRKFQWSEVKSIENALRRFDEYLEYANDKPCAFTCKIPVYTLTPDNLLESVGVSSAYNISMHIFPKKVSDEILLNNNILSDTEERWVFDFRETAANRCDHQRNFAGNNKRIEIDEQAFKTSFVRKLLIYYLDPDSDSYYPGMFQNLILPAFDIQWGDAAFRKEVTAFRWKMVERFRHERSIRPDEYQSLSLSHTRSSVFSDQMVQSIDSHIVIS